MNRTSHVGPLAGVASVELGSQPAASRSSAVSDLVSTSFVKLPAWFTVTAALRVAELKRVSHVLILAGSAVSGVIATEELRVAPPQAPLAGLAQKTESFLRAEDDAASAWMTMTEQGVRCLPVAKGAMLLGIVTRDALESGRRGLPS